MRNSKMLLAAVFSIALAFSPIPLASVAGGSSSAVSVLDEGAITHSAVDSSSLAATMALNTSGGLVTPMLAAGCDFTLGLKSDGTVVAVGLDEYNRSNVSTWTDIVRVAAGGHHAVGLRSDGTVVTTGCGEACDVGNWTGIREVDGGVYYTVGLKSDGTVVAVGFNEYGQCDVSSWTDIVQVDAGARHTVGLMSDGIVVATGLNDYGQCDVGEWTNIIQSSAGSEHTVGLKSDGTVVAAGRNALGECDVAGWTNIIHVTAGYLFTAGLRSDGTVLAVGMNGYGACDVGDWTDMVQVAAGYWHLVGLRSDGTVAATGWIVGGQCDVAGWTDIAQVAGGNTHTAGLKSDGTAIAVGNNYCGQCDVADWTDIIQVTAGSEATVGVKSDGTVVAVGNGAAWCVDWTDIVDVSASVIGHTVGVRSDGTVVAEGVSNEGQCDVGDWTGVIQVTAGGHHTVGLKPDGTVVAVGRSESGQCDIGAWTEIIQVAAGYEHTIGLRSAGTVVAAGTNWAGQCDVGDWADTVQIAAGGHHTVGLKSDGTVVAVGWNDHAQCDVDGWADIVQIAAGWSHTLGVKSDGTVVAAGAEIELAKILLVIKASLHSPVEIRICDSQGRVTGLVDGEAWDEIPWATFDEDDESISVLYGFDEYYYELEGISSGSYGLTFDVASEGQTSTFSATDVPITSDEIHRYYVDWYACSRGERGITIEKDYDGDGEADEVIITGIPMPTNPSPMDDAREVPLDQELGWVVDDPDVATCDVYFGTEANPPLVSEGQAETTYSPTLHPNTRYYWRVTAINEYHIFAAGSLWEFITGDEFGPPEADTFPWCFIATAAYGTPMANQVQTLRDFRDRFLLTNPVGQALVGLYYKVGPAMADFITDHPSLKPVVRVGLVPAVAVSTVAVNTTLPEKTAIVSLLVLVSVAVGICAARRRGRYADCT